MSVLRPFLKDGKPVTMRRLELALSAAQLEELKAHPPRPYISLSYGAGFSPQLGYNEGDPYVFLAPGTSPDNLEQTLVEAVVWDRLDASKVYGNSQEKEPYQQVTQPLEEPQQKPAMQPEDARYYVRNEVKITEGGTIGVVKVEKKVKQGSIMGFLKKK